MDVNVLDYGAIPDSTKALTSSFQKAIDTCHQTGGGQVFVPKGRYYLGRIELKSHVHLVLLEGAILIASSRLQDFSKDELKIQKLTEPTWNACDYDGSPHQFFIYAIHCLDIGIEGKGTIDGNEEIFYGSVSKYHIDGSYYPRVPMIYFEDCQNVLLKDVTFQKSAFWTVHLVGCRDVLIHSITILNNLRLANCDGIDPDSCQNVQISHCKITSADDCIVFKTTKHAKKYGPCQDIKVDHCTLVSTSAAIKFGSESTSDFINIEVKDCKILKSNRGISLQLRDEGSIKNCHFENIFIETRLFSPIHWWGKAEPISLTAVRRTKNTQLGKISNITFKNIMMDTENGITMYGMEENISDIRFESCKLIIRNKTKWEKNQLDLRPSEEVGLKNKPMNVIYVYGVQDVLFLDCSYQLEESIRKLIHQDYSLEKSVRVYAQKNELLKHIDEIHTTEQGKNRIYKNTGLTIEDIQRIILMEDTSILRATKNYYVFYKNFIICIHAGIYTVITAHEVRK